MILIISSMLVVLNIFGPATAKCPPDKPVVNCLVDPCDPRFRREPPCARFYAAPLTCKSNFCGGCNAVWFDATGAKIECSEIAFPICRNPVACFVDPCQFARLPAGCPSGLTCVSNFCGGCNAVWVDNRGEPHPCVLPCGTDSTQCSCKKCKRCKKRSKICPLGKGACPGKNKCCCCKKKKFDESCVIST